MKRILLTIPLLFISLSSFAVGRLVVVTTTNTSTTRPAPKPRSGVITPVVYVDTNAAQLTISMVSSESYTLYVYDGSGAVVCQGSVVSDGGRHVYMLPELEADLYTIEIEGGSASYEGEFYAN